MSTLTAIVHTLTTWRARLNIHVELGPADNDHPGHHGTDALTERADPYTLPIGFAPPRDPYAPEDTTR